MSVDVRQSAVEFRFPYVHEDAVLTIYLHRTLRVPDDGQKYGLPPGLGGFDVRAVSDLERPDVPPAWSRNDVVMPMWQSEACWMSFISPSGYPFLVKVGAGAINAVTGDQWSDRPDFAGEDYVEVPTQPWLDGFCVDDSTVRQFVAMPLGGGYTVEEQLNAEHASVGGLQFAVYPLRSEIWAERKLLMQQEPMVFECAMGEPAGEMGLGAGGSISQTVATPIEPHDNWDLDSSESTFVHIANSAQWQDFTGATVPSPPLTIAEYTEHGFPWFEWYDDSLARQGSSRLASAKTVNQVGEEKGEQPLPDNGGFTPPTPIIVGP